MSIEELDYYSEPRHVPFRRSLAILKRLKIGQATHAQLVQSVDEFVNNAYVGTAKAKCRLFEGDILRLRELGAKIEYEDKTYRLVECGNLLS